MFFFVLSGFVLTWSATVEWMIILCVLLVIAVATRDLTDGRFLLRSRPLVKLGEWSYAFYLIHATAVYAVLAWLGWRPPSWSNLAWYAGMLVISIALAAALHYAVEKPCERYLRAAWDRRRARRKEAAGVDPDPERSNRGDVSSARVSGSILP